MRRSVARCGAARTSTGWRSTVWVALAAVAAPVSGQVPGTAEAGARSAHPAAAEAGRAFLGALAEEANLPGLQAAVWHDGEVVWSESFGYADLEHRTPVTRLTRLRLGSLSKPFTAAAVMTLREAGRLDLDAPLRRYVPTFPAKRRPVTVRQLAGHLGGVRHYRDDESQLRYRTHETVTESIELFAADSLLHRPGATYEYSSYGYNLLGAAVEGASGEHYLTHLRTAVLEPLGLRHTVADHVDSIIPHRAASYAESDVDGRLLNAPHTNNSYKWPSGGLLPTAEDLVTFAGELAAGRLLADSSVAVMFESMVTAAGDTTGYAMGWRPRRDARGRRVLRHGGGSVGGRAFLLLYPDHRLAVAILVNASLAPVFQEEAEPIAHFFLDHPPGAGPIGAAAEELAGVYRFTSRRGDEDVSGILRLTGDVHRPGRMDWEGGARPVPLVIVGRHGDETLLLGAGVHGALTVRATFRADGFAGSWDWLGRTRPIRGEADEEHRGDA